MLMLPMIALFAADVEASAAAGTRQQRPYSIVTVKHNYQ